MTIVLMDSLHHRTVSICGGAEIIVPVDLRWRDATLIVEAVFVPTGTLLFGDPIYYQSKGPTLPDSWWHR